MELTLTEPTAYESFFGVRVVRGDGTGRRLTVADVPRAWLEKHFAQVDDPTRPLHRAGISLFDNLQPGVRSATVTIPIRRDALAEGTELLTLKSFWGRQRVVRTIRVTD